MTKIILPARRGEETPVKFNIRCPAFLPRPSAKVNRQIAKYFEASAAAAQRGQKQKKSETVKKKGNLAKATTTNSAQLP